MILQAYQCGQRVFGENKAREMEEKHQQLPADIEWHFIGHLQSNKVKYIAPFVHLIQAVDREELLPVINREAVKNKRIIHCLLQFHIATEETKYGMNWEEAAHLLESETLAQCDHLRIIGVMGMASFTEDTALIRKEFSTLYHYYLLMKNSYFRDNPDFKEISMGMSGDYPLAIEEGSTMIRVGTLLFGIPIGSIPDFSPDICPDIAVSAIKIAEDRNFRKTEMPQQIADLLSHCTVYFKIKLTRPAEVVHCKTTY